MQAEDRWTRRRLLKVGGLGVGAGVASSFGVAARALQPERAAEVQNAYVYVASAGTAAEKHRVQVYRVRGGRWEPLQFVPSRSPSSLTLSPDGRTLFVTNRVDAYEGLPTSSVEAWAIDSRTGALSLLNRQGLALAAVSASHADVSPDGSTLAVSAANGALCVLLPVGGDGSLGATTAVRKELRFKPAAAEGASASRSTQLCFASDGTLLLADYSEHVVSALTFAAGPLELVGRAVLPMDCTSASLQRRASSVDIHLHDAERRRIGMLSYAGGLATVQGMGARFGDPRGDAVKALLESASSLRSGESLSRMEATHVDMTEQQGRCLLRGERSAGTESLRPRAMAWVRV